MKTQACTFFSIVQIFTASVNCTWQPCANSLIIDHQTLICPIIASTFVIWHIMYVCLTDLQITDARSNLFPGAVEYHGCLAPVLWQPSILEAGAAMPILRTPSDKFHQQIQKLSLYKLVNPLCHLHPGYGWPSLSEDKTEVTIPNPTYFMHPFVYWLCCFHRTAWCRVVHLGKGMQNWSIR